MGESLTWLGIIFCITQSAIFSGLNLAFFSLTRLRLEIEAEMSGSKGANKVLQMRKDSNFLLTTILWGNVGINVLLTLLSNSVMTGLVSFTFSTFIITIFGEIVPQAYFSRNALKMASLLAPVLRIYQFLLYPVAKPCALLLDSWLGKETKQFFSEENIKMFIAKHIEEDDSEIDKMEGIGAINFLTLDDTLIIDEGEDINHDSIVQLRSEKGKLIFPEYTPTVSDPFIQRINRSDEKWIIFTDETNTPKLVIDADGFIRSMFMHPASSMENIYKYTHTPIVVRKNALNLGELVLLLKNNDNTHSDHPIKKDIAILWNEKYKKIITGADLFGRLLKGI